MLLLRSVNGDANGKMLTVLLDKVLNSFLMVIDAIGGERETVAIEPMMVSSKEFSLDIVANLIDKLYFKERLAADKVPHHRLVGKIGVGFMIEHIVDEGLGHLPRHPFFHVLAHEVAIFASQLAILGDDEGDAFC